jgi:hypothetical protein
VNGYHLLIMFHYQKDADAETSFGDTPISVKPPRSQLFNKPQGEQTPEEKARADRIDLRCLSLCAGMLERVNSVRDFPSFNADLGLIFQHRNLKKTRR